MIDRPNVSGPPIIVNLTDGTFPGAVKFENDADISRSALRWSAETPGSDLIRQLSGQLNKQGGMEVIGGSHRFSAFKELDQEFPNRRWAIRIVDVYDKLTDEEVRHCHF